MKKLFSVLLAATMMFTLAGCGEEKTPDNPNQTSIKVWTYPVGKFGDKDAVNGIVSAFNAKYPDIKVQVDYLDYSTGDDQVKAALEAGTAPDIILEGPERLVTNWGKAGKMVDLSDLWTDELKADIAKVSTAVEPACQYEGKYYEYPLVMTTHSMAINYEAFEEAGALQYLDLENRTWTTENFWKAMEALKAKFPDKITGIVYCGGQGGDQGTRALVKNLYSGSYTDEAHTKYTMDDPNMVKALKELQEKVKAGLLDSDAAMQASDELQQFANGTALMSFCWNPSNEANYASQVAFTPFTMAFPSDDGVPELDGGIWGFGIVNNGDQAKIDAAKKFITFVCDDPDQAAKSAQLTGFFPVRSSLGNVYAGTPEEASRAVFADMGQYLGDYYNVTPNWTEQRTAWWQMLQSIFSGTDVEQAVATYQAAANK